MANNQGYDISLDIIGKTIAGILCHKFHILNDVLVVEDQQGSAAAIKLSSLSGNIKMHTIDNQAVDTVQVTKNGKMFLFTTKTKQYLVNNKNEIVEDSTNWHDSFFEELSSSFYRKDKQGQWYDIEGFRMQEKVFLKEDVLTSLDTKQSKQSVSFKDCDIYISENKQLIQVGKLVLNTSLEVVKYFGEKITGLGSSNVAFDGKDVLQEVKLGLTETAFINEFTFEPYLFQDTKIRKHLDTYQYGKKRVVVFQTETKSYGVEGSSDNFLTFGGIPLQIEADKYVNFNDAELIKVFDGKKSFYFDLNKNEPFGIASLDNKHLTNIDPNYVRLGKSKVYSVASPTEEFVVREDGGEVFKLDDGTIKPQKLEDAEGYAKYYGFATIDGQRKLFSKKAERILKFGTDELEVSDIIYNDAGKFINAIDTNGKKLVLDLRLGFEEISMAEVNGEKIAEIYGEAMPIANKTLQNVFVETYGGSIRRVININEKVLSYFTLPSSLKQISDQESQSVFANSFLSEVQFFDETVLDGKTFISAEFESFTGKVYPIILEKETGAPIHLQGTGHRNELATTWVHHTIKTPFYLGSNRMLGVNTISEDQKEHQLLFSVQKLTSWLPFFDNYLPIFKQVVDAKEVSESWDYHLFELRELSKEKEYIAVEKVTPYRILADRKSGQFQPRIVKGKKKSIKSPDELSYLQRIFYADSGMLVEIE